MYNFSGLISLKTLIGFGKLYNSNVNCVAPLLKV